MLELMCVTFVVMMVGVVTLGIEGIDYIKERRLRKFLKEG